MKGFTLIETVIYIALLALVMGAALATSYELLKSSDASSTLDSAGMEADFVLRKLDWAWGDDAVVLRQGSSSIEIDEGQGYMPLTSTPGAQISFAHLTGPSGERLVVAAIVVGSSTLYAKHYDR